jgi:hypothetical protein
VKAVRAIMSTPDREKTAGARAPGQRRALAIPNQERLETIIE